MNRIKSYVDEILRISSSESKISVFLIGNTSKVIEDDFYSIPIRSYSQFVVTGAIVSGESIAQEIAKFIDGKIDYVFVDSEKKIIDRHSVSTTPGNIQRAVSEIISKSILVSYKANDLTVDAADFFIAEYFSRDVANLGGKKTAIIGSGNIGSKISAKLVERGSDVSMFRRETTKLKRVVDYINDSKPKYTIAVASAAKSISEACESADIIIGLTNGVQVINQKEISLANKKPLIIDIGKGSISKQAVIFAHSNGIEVYRLSIESALEGMIITSISTHNIFTKKTGRSTHNGINLVSGSILALNNEFVVDNFKKPKIIYGLGNGEGDFERNPSQEMLIKLNALEKIAKDNKKNE
jgi:hypothetical protein